MKVSLSKFNDYLYLPISDSHLMGFFYRTIRMVDNGIKPVYVFDGKPPTMKGGELAKRKERRDEAQKALEQAEEAGECCYCCCYYFYCYGWYYFSSC